MAALPALKLATYLLVLDAFVALHLTEVLGPLESGIILAAALASWWSDRMRAAVASHRRLWDIATVGFAAFSLLDILYLADSFIAGVIHLLLYITLYKLFNRRATRDYLDLYVVSFFQLVAAAALTTSFAYLFVFVTFMILGTWTFTLFHLLREAEAVGSGGLTLETARIVTPSFLLSGLGVSLVALVLTLGIFLVIPRIGRAFIPFKSRFGTLVTGFSDTVDLGSYGSIQTDPSVVMRVEFPDGPPPADVRFRGVAFDAFDGHTWRSSEARHWILLRAPDGLFHPARPTPGRPFVRQDIFLEPIGVEVLFGVPRMVALQVNLPAVYMDSQGSVGAAGPPPTRIRYAVISQPESPPSSATGERALPANIRAAYLQLPEVSPRIRALAQEIVGGITDPAEQAHRVEAYLQANLRYSLDLKRDPALDPLDDFLFQQRSGNCEYFAASMAVMLRTLGVPARVVNGFQHGEWNEVGRYFVVRQRDAHSWVEVYLPGAGWVTYDPSPRAAFEAQQDVPTLGLAGRYLDTLRWRWNRYIIDYNLGDQILLAWSVKRRSQAVRDDFGRRLAALRRWARTRGGTLAAAGGGPALLVIALGAGALFLRRSAGHDRRDRRPGALRVPFYEQALTLLGRHGMRKREGQTAAEFAAQAAPRLNGGAACLRELTSLYYRVRFGGEPLTPEELQRTTVLLDGVRQGLGAGRKVSRR